IIINPSHFNQEKLQLIQNIAKIQHTKLLSYKDISFIDLGAFKFTLLDTNIENSADPNEHSIITLASIDQTHILLMGDATEKNELKLLANYRLPKIQILKVGHHGSQTSSS
ncbi:DNA internalization-related competence protein ComEC/Rec2, partial [Staphylococcus pseudintermedius]